MSRSAVTLRFVTNMKHLSPGPEELLSQVQSSEKGANRGLFKVFLGYTSGVGKSARMLERHDVGKKEERMS